MSVDEARQLLTVAGLFFDEDEDEPELRQTLNLNDVWGWALADCMTIPDDDLPEVARLFHTYGWCGVLYWVSEKRNGLQSEFFDINRFIEFVRHEEAICKAIPDSDKRAYKALAYVVGVTPSEPNP